MADRSSDDHPEQASRPDSGRTKRKPEPFEGFGLNPPRRWRRRHRVNVGSAAVRIPSLRFNRPVGLAALGIEMLRCGMTLLSTSGAIFPIDVLHGIH
jgi:hypothetical protein